MPHVNGPKDSNSYQGLGLNVNGGTHRNSFYSIIHLVGGGYKNGIFLVA